MIDTQITKICTPIFEGSDRFAFNVKLPYSAEKAVNIMLHLNIMKIDFILATVTLFAYSPVKILLST